MINFSSYDAFGEVWVHIEVSTLFLPVSPIFLAYFGSLISDPVINVSPRTQDITSEVSFFGGWDSFQEADCGRENMALKKEVKDEFAMKNSPYSNAREYTSSILFSSPAMDIDVSEDTCVWWIRIPNIWRRRAAGIDLLVRSLYAHFTADALSQNPRIQILGTV